jgi:hypothetical protein
MDKKAVRVLFVSLLLVGILHGFFHFFILKTGVSELAGTGMSGLALTETNWLDDIKAKASPGNSLSGTVLAVEWGVILLALALMAIRRKKLDKEEFDLVNVAKLKVEKTWTKTDLDNLYEVLKERKDLKLQTISKAYGVDKNVVMSWGRALETAGLIRIEYPLFADPKFIYEEKK